MVSRRGISVLDLVLGLPGGTATVFLPDDVQHTLESFAVLEHTTTTTTASYVHEGTTQALGDEPLALPGVLGWKLESPVVTTGLRFRVVRTRAQPAANQNVDPPSITSTVDLYLDPLALTIPGLVPAVVAGGTFGSADPAHLVPAANRGDVRVWGRAILRITLGPPVNVALVDWPDPFDPNAVAGAVTELAFDPPTFLVGQSGFGATVDRVVVDLDRDFTPADIVARGQDATWQGVSLREGTLYFPRGADRRRPVDRAARPARRRAARRQRSAGRDRHRVRPHTGEPCGRRVRRCRWCAAQRDQRRRLHAGVSPRRGGRDHRNTASRGGRPAGRSHGHVDAARRHAP